MATQQPASSVSGIEKTPTGIEGFDEITRGGLPRRRTTLVIGAPGTGKTVFALQTLVNGAREWNEPGIFVAFEENSAEIVQNAATFGWDLLALEKQKLFFLDARMEPDIIQAGSFDLAGMLASLKAKADEMGARRIVFDSIDVLLTLIDNRAAERRELYRMRDWLVTSQLTGLITARTDTTTGNIAPRYEFMQFMSDCVVLLDHRVHERLSLREVRVLKYRGSGFNENEFSMLINGFGMEVFSPQPIESDYPVFNERVSSGVVRLDAMLDGGYYRGSTVLLTGAPGTAKSTLSGVFANAACQRGEKTLIVSFDETSAELTRNLATLGIDLTQYIEAGLLQIFSARQQPRSAEAHLITIRKLIREFKPQCLVINPLSTMLQTSEQIPAINITQQIISLTKSAGITALFTSLLPQGGLNLEATPFQTSTLVDTWIHLSYVTTGGERNRALTIIKSRGTTHSNQVRELVLSDQGITLTDVYKIDGEVLMGTLRYEQEALDQLDQEKSQIEFENQQIDLEIAEAEIAARIEVAQRELAAKQLARRKLQTERAKHKTDQLQRQANLRQLRGADEPGGANIQPPTSDNSQSQDRGSETE